MTDNTTGASLRRGFRHVPVCRGVSAGSGPPRMSGPRSFMPNTSLAWVDLTEEEIPRRWGIYPTESLLEDIDE